MKKLTILCAALFVTATVSGKEPYPGTSIYENFINSTNTSAVDYVFDLFERFDIVILAERDYRDATQYELIRKIMLDDRFRMVSNVMCEVGSNNHTGNVNRLINRKFDSDEELYRGVMDFVKDMTYWPLWFNTNYVDFLCSLNDYNIRVDGSDRLTLTLLDVPFDWGDPKLRNSTGYWKYCKEIMPRRPAVMAKNFIDAYESSGKGKALVILNSPNSYRAYRNKHMEGTAAEYIFEWYPGKVANVFLNWALVSKNHPGDEMDKLIGNGAWDKAFENCGYKEIGFDMAGSPFGDTQFKDMIKPPKRTTYKDIFTGFIYYKSPMEFIAETGFKYEFDEEFSKEFITRLSILRNEKENKKYISLYNRGTMHHAFPIYQGNKNMERQLDKRAIGFGSTRISKGKKYLLYYFGESLDSLDEED